MTLNIKIQALESSVLEDGAKWRLMLDYKRALEEKRTNDPVLALKRKLTKSMYDKRVTIKDIRNNHNINPYPVGRSSLELVLSGIAISNKLTRKLSIYLNGNKKVKFIYEPNQTTKTPPIHRKHKRFSYSQ